MLLALHARTQGEWRFDGSLYDPIIDRPERAPVDLDRAVLLHFAFRCVSPPIRAVLANHPKEARS